MHHQFLKYKKRWYFIVFDGNDQAVATSVKTYGTLRAASKALSRMFNRK